MTAQMTFDDNDLAMQLFGSHHRNLARIEQKLDVAINARGNEVTITGDDDAVEATGQVLNGLYGRLEQGKEVGTEDVEAVLRMAVAPNGDIGDADVTIKTHKKHISPRSPVQADYLRAIDWQTGLNTGLDHLFDRYDAILTPATTGEAPKGLEATGSPMFCTLWTYCGVPAVTLPLLEGSNGLPMGVQLVGPRGYDARLLRTANWLAGHVSGPEK